MLTLRQYSGRDVEDFEAKIDENVSRLVHLLGTYIDNRKPFDLARKAHYFTVDVVSNLAFGKPFGNLESDTDVHGYIQTMEKYLPILVVSTVMAWARNLLYLPIFRPFMPTEHDVLGVGRIMRYNPPNPAARTVSC